MIVNLKSLFERVVLINLERRPDRLASVKQEMIDAKWPFKPPIRFNAIDGKIVPVSLGWTMGGGTYGCVLPGAFVQGRIQKALKSWYSGSCVELTTRSGQRLSLTVNHPVLTEHGFISAGSLQKRQNLVGYRSNISDRMVSSVDNVQHTPTTIEQIFNTSLRQGSKLRSKLHARFDLYGDGEFIKGNIDVVDVNRQLRDEVNTKTLQSLANCNFIRRYIEHILLSFLRSSNPCMSLSRFDLFSGFGFIPNGLSFLTFSNFDSCLFEDVEYPYWSRRTSRRDPKFFCKLLARFPLLVLFEDVFAFLFGNLTTSDFVSFGRASELDVPFSKTTGENVDSKSCFLRNLTDRFPGKIFFDELVEVRRFDFNGHVYDLQTDVGYFTTNHNYTHDTGYIIANCRQSHVGILQQAMMDGIESILVLEDDLTILSDEERIARGQKPFLEACTEFFENVPDDWDQLMLGGQHIHPGRPLKPGIIKCVNCQRTHAYAIRGRFMRDLYAIWNSPAGQTHVDHVMGPMQPRYKVYAPDPFLFGQARSKSDINGRVNPAKFWEPPTGKEPLVILECPKDVVVELRRFGVHTGYNRHKDSDIDNGLIKAFQEDNPEGRLRQWVYDLQMECKSEEGLILAVWHPKASRELLQRCWGGPVTTIKADTVEDALVLLPGQKKRVTIASEYIILLHEADKATVGMLRAIGWHTGNWRDSITDLDNGLREWAVNKKPDKLREIIDCLVREAEGMKNGVTCLWHPELTVDHVREVTKLKVVEIRTNSSEQALIQWQEFRDRKETS